MASLGVLAGLVLLAGFAGWERRAPAPVLAAGGYTAAFATAAGLTALGVLSVRA